MKNTAKIIWIDETMPLPKPELALRSGEQFDGLVAAGGGLSTSRLYEAYLQGIFPWFSEGQPVLWWSPDPRMVLKINDFKLHRSLSKTLKNFQKDAGCEVRMDSAFESVIRHCAKSTRKGQIGTWILEEMIQAYVSLHREGFAHSVETWVHGQLVGGLYCVSIGDTLFGESMFAKQTDASKIALAGLIAFSRSQGLSWIDCQQNTKHLASLGAKEISRTEFLALIKHARKDTQRKWNFDPATWNLLIPNQHKI